MDGVEVLPAAMNIWNPLPRLPRIVEVKHRSDSVHPQAVDVIFVEPEKRVADEKIPHLVSAKIENERAPILLFALARVQVLVEIGAIELGQRVGVLWKM